MTSKARSLGLQMPWGVFFDGDSAKPNLILQCWPVAAQQLGQEAIVDLNGFAK